MLREAGHQVCQLIEENPDGNLRAAGSLMLSTWNPLAIRRVAKAVEDFRPDVAHVHNTWFAMSPAVIRALKRADVPLVMTLHNYRLICKRKRTIPSALKPMFGPTRSGLQGSPLRQPSETNRSVSRPEIRGASRGRSALRAVSRGVPPAL